MRYTVPPPASPSARAVSTTKVSNVPLGTSTVSVPFTTAV